MSLSQVAVFDAYRTLGHASISGSYAAVGGILTHAARLICFTNNTDGDLIVSTDGTTNMLFLPKASFKLFDLTTNREVNANVFVFTPGTQFYVKQSTAPSSGGFYIEVIYALGN